MEKRRAAVVILNWNGEQLLKQFLPSVIANSDDCAEVYVADNGSTDGSVSMLKRDFPAVKLIVLDRNYGFAEGYNRALAQVEAEFYVLLNSDVEVEAGWVREMMAFLDRRPDMAACQPIIRRYAARDHFEYAGAAGGYMDGYGYPFCRGRIFDTVELDEGQYNEDAAVFWATGAALMVRRSDWELVGGFDARFFAHQEEIDLCWRLHRCGRNVGCVTAVRVWHVGGASLNQGNPRKTFLNFRNNLVMLYKNLPERELRRVMRCRWWLDQLAALQFLLKGDVGNARAVWRGRRAYRDLRPVLDEERRRDADRYVTDDVPGRFPFSLLVAYYLRGCKCFSRLAARYPVLNPSLLR